MIITNSEQLQQALEFINANEILAYDIESTGLNVRKDNIIGFGFSNKDSGFYLPLASYSVHTGLTQIQGAHEMANAILQSLSSKKILCFNASFDLRFTQNRLGLNLLPALHCDVLLLKHTCDEDYPLALKDIARDLYGQDATKEKEEMQASIKTNGGTSKEYYKADTEILGRYCIQDCILTYKLYSHFSKDLARQGLTTFFYEDEVMPLYKDVTLPMEAHGVKLDMALLQNSLKEIKLDLMLVEDEIQAAILPKLDLFTAWFLNKDYPITTYKSGKPSAWTKKYDTAKQVWRAENDGYMFNLLSKHHLKKLFFDTLKEEPISKTEKGNPQVDEEFLEKMGAKYEWARKLIIFNKLTKIKGTYIERFLEEQEDGYFYPSFQQHRTVSGRYSGDLQQLPRPIIDDGGLVAKYTNRIRAFLIASEGAKLMSADYEQLEPRVFCHVSKDAALASIFNQGQDFYTRIGCMVLKLPELTKKQRQDAKTYALGIPYGMTGYKLKFEIGCTDDEADVLVARYLSTFAELKQWMLATKDRAQRDGFVRSELGRVRRMPQVARIWNKYYNVIDNDLELWKAFHQHPGVYAQAKADRKIYKNLINNANNFQIQSMAASIMNRASIRIARELVQNNLRARIIGQVHDELVLHVPEIEVEQVSAIVKGVMENNIKLSVPLITKPQIGNNYKECK